MVRGTQSFVGVMAEVWKRPLWTLAEVGWRWLAGIPLLVFVWLHGGREAFGAPETFLAALDVRLEGGHVVALHRAEWIAGIVWLLWWCVLSAVGRVQLLRRLGVSRAGLLRNLPLTWLRVAAFTCIVALWVRTVGIILRHGRIDIAQWSTNPNMVLAFAEGVVLTLLLFVLWALVSWVLRLAPVIAAAQGVGAGAALARVGRNKELRSKLMEVNLVMGIVKVALLVLVLVFSSSPLPFQAIATKDFLTWWWVGVLVWYAVASDFFHVVRLAGYVRLYQALEG